VTIEQLRQAIDRGCYRVTRHARNEAWADALLMEDVCHSVLHGEVIEDYPTDKPFPSCLVLGHGREGSAIHSVWAYNGATETAVVVTVHRPDPDRWIDFRARRSKP